MSKYSDLYTNNSTTVENFVEISQPMSTLYEVGDELDRSCVWAISNVWNELYTFPSGQELIEDRKVAQKKFKTNFGIALNYMSTPYNYEYSMFQFGNGDSYPNTRKSNNETQIVLNFKTKNILLTLANVTGRNKNDYNDTKTLTLKNIVDNEYPDYLIYSNDLFWAIHSRVLKDDGVPILSSDRVRPLIVAFDGEDSSFKGFSNLGFFELLNNSWLNRTGNFYGGSQGNIIDYNSETAKYMHSSFTSLSYDFSETYETMTTGFYALDEDNYLYAFVDTYVTNFKGAYITSKRASEILASFGLYFSFVPVNDTKTINQRAIDGEIVLGEMNSDGYTTGKWLKTVGEIENAVNYDKSLENEDLDPYKKPESEDYEDDKSDSVKYGLDVNNYLGAFLNFYCCKVSDLGALKNWMNTYDGSELPPGVDELPAGFDPSSQLVALLAFPCPVNLQGTSPGEDFIKFRIAQGKSISTGIRCPVSTGGVYKFDFGEIVIPKRMEQRGVPFLDYGTTIELYLPFAGTFNLDTQTCIGRTLKVEGYFCIGTGQINYIVTVDKDGATIPVCYASGDLSAQMPISSTGWGTYLANQQRIVQQGITSGIGDAANAAKNAYLIKQASQADIFKNMQRSFSNGQMPTAAQARAVSQETMRLSGMSKGAMIATAVMGAISVGSDIYSSYIQSQHNKNASYTVVSGALSGTASWFMPLHPYVRLIRPRFKKPSNYAHTVSIPLVTTKKIGRCSGLSTFNNTDVSSINCTFNEQQIISQYLANGIYV